MSGLVKKCAKGRGSRLAPPFKTLSVTALLADRWSDKAGSTQKIANISTDRVGSPSSYPISADQNTHNEMAAFTHAEAAALAREEAFGVGSRFIPSNTVDVNEHAMRSFEEFLGEVCKAWDLRQERLDVFLVRSPYA